MFNILNIAHDVVGHATRSVAMHGIRQGGYALTRGFGLHGMAGYIVVALIAAGAWVFVRKLGRTRKK